MKSDKVKPEVVVNNEWPEAKGLTRIPTILQYDEGYKNIIAWGAGALVRDHPKPVELFLSHLRNVPESKKPKLPEKITPERAITDYFREMGNNDYVFFV